LSVRKHDSIELAQIIPLLIAALLLTIGLAMFLSGTRNLIDVVQPVIVVFGGTLVSLLVTFSLPQLAQALQSALERGIRGGTAPQDMIRAMLKVCDISRKEGLLGVADIRSSSDEVEEACHLIGDAAHDSVIRFNLDRRLASERVYSQVTSDVFLFPAVFAVLTGLLGSMIRLVSPVEGTAIGSAALPFICGVSLALLTGILIGRMRAAHLRKMVTTEIAYRAASVILEDNNLQRLYTRLIMLVPAGIRA